MSGAEARKPIGTVSFSTTGEYLTDYARGLVLSENWKGGLSIFTDGPDGLNHDIAMAILKGEKALGGCSVNGFTLDDDSPANPETARYLETFAFQNCGLLNIKSRTYRPAYIIEALGSNDYQYALDRLGREAKGTPEFTKLRALFYVSTLKQEFHVTVPKAEIRDIQVDLRETTSPNEMLVIWEERSFTPAWAVTTNDAMSALSSFLDSRSPMTLGADTSLMDLKRDPEAYYQYLIKKGNLTEKEQDERDELSDLRYAKEIGEIREAVINRAGPQDSDGWIRLHVSSDNVLGESEHIDFYKPIPRAPFLYWALQPYDPSKLGLCEPWSPISRSGFKLQNDDPFHTDWVIGAGYDPEVFYRDDPVNNSSWALRIELCSSMLKFEFSPLSRSTKKSLSGKLRHIKPGETIDTGEIGVIECASIKYDAALRSAAKHGTGLICLTGGPLAHIATVGREMDVPILLWDKARDLRNGSKIYIDLENGTIELRART